MTSPKKDKTKEEKRKVVLLLAGISLVIFFFLWRFVFSIPKVEEIPVMAIKKTVPMIDFEYLERVEFNSFVGYETIPAIDKEMFGRENPFNPISE